MDRAEIHDRLTEWIAETTREPTVKNSAPFQVSVDPRFLTRIGHIPEGHTSPPAGIEDWRVNLELWFPRQGPPDDPYDVGLAIARILDALADAAAADPSLGGRFRRARWRGTDSSEPSEPEHAPDGFPYRVEAYISLEP